MYSAEEREAFVDEFRFGRFFSALKKWCVAAFEHLAELSEDALEGENLDRVQKCTHDFLTGCSRPLYQNQPDQPYYHLAFDTKLGGISLPHWG